MNLIAILNETSVTGESKRQQIDEMSDSKVSKSSLKDKLKGKLSFGDSGYDLTNSKSASDKQTDSPKNNGSGKEMPVKDKPKEVFKRNDSLTDSSNELGESKTPIENKKKNGKDKKENGKGKVNILTQGNKMTDVQSPKTSNGSDSVVFKFPKDGENNTDKGRTNSDSSLSETANSPVDKHKLKSKVSFDESGKTSPKLKRQDKSSSSDIYPVSGKPSKMFCQPCNANEKVKKAKFFCYDCAEYQCLDCSSAHKVLTFAKNHNIVPTSQAKEKPAAFSMKGLDLCKQHQEMIKFICEDHNTLCCGRCAFTNHRQCSNVVEIEFMTTPASFSLENLKQDLLEVGAKASGIVQRVKRQKGKFTTDASGITDKIQTMQDEVTEKFRNLKKAVQKDLDVFRKQVFQDCDSRQSLCKSYIAAVEQSLSEIQEVMLQGTEAQQIITNYQIKDRIAELRAKIHKEQTTMKDVVLTLSFDHNIKLPPAANSTPGKFSLKYVKPTDFEINVDSDQQPSTSLMSNLILIASIDLKQEAGDKHEPLFTGIDFLSDGRLVAVENKNDKCVVFNEKLEKVAEASLSYKPQDLTVLNEDEIAVTSGNEFMIEFFRISQDNKISALRAIKVSIECGSVCMMGNDSFIVGTIDDSQPIRLLTVEGEEKSLGVTFPEKKYPVRHSACAYIQNQSKVVLTDRYADTVFIYDIATNTKVEVKEENILKHPRDVAVGPADCLFVCCEKTNTLIQIAHTGEILASYKLDMLFTCRVNVSKDNKRLAVSNAFVGGKKLQLYEIADGC